LFGPISDRYGRKRVLLITMVLYAVGTALCAFVTSIEQLIVCRVIASLGIGGEWAAGCALVAEVVPEDQRVEAGAVLYTAAPFGLFLATGVNALVAGYFFADVPEVSWRYVLIFGLLPAAFAIWVRTFVKEPERWEAAAAKAPPPRLRELFTPEIWPRTRSALLVALIALLTWWSCNAFIPVVVAGLAQAEALQLGLDRTATSILTESWKTQATTIFNLGGLIGTLLTIPLAKRWGRKPMFAVYLGCSAISLLTTFGLDLPPQVRLYMYFFIGLTVFGIFGSFTFYLPELFPTRLRATGSGFTYNIGRVVAAAGPFFVGSVAAAGSGDPSVVLNTLFMVGFIPLIGLLGIGWVIETRGQRIPD
jgi:MFS family permease